MLYRIYFYLILIVAVSAFGIVEWFVFTEFGWKAALFTLGIWGLIALICLFNPLNDPEHAKNVMMNRAYKHFPANIHYKEPRFDMTTPTAKNPQGLPGHHHKD